MTNINNNENTILEQKDWILKKYILFLKKISKSLIKEIRIKSNDIEIKTTPNNLRPLLYILQKHTLCQYKQLIDIACCDVPGKKNRFSISSV